MTLKNNRAPLLSMIKLYASSHHHMWIQTGVTVRKRLSWVVTSVTLTFDLWPWPFAWTSLLSLVITPENFMMTGWWEHSQKGVTDGRTDGQTDGQTDWTIHRAAWSQLKIRFGGHKSHHKQHIANSWWQNMWAIFCESKNMVSVMPSYLLCYIIYRILSNCTVTELECIMPVDVMTTTLPYHQTGYTAHVDMYGD